MKIQVLALFCGLAGASAAHAADIPTMSGDWTGRTQPIVAGKGSAHWKGNKGTFDKPALPDRALTLRVVGQDGRRFWGQTIIAGDASTGGAAGSGSSAAIASTGGAASAGVAGETASLTAATGGKAAAISRPLPTRSTLANDIIAASAAKPKARRRARARSGASSAASTARRISVAV